LIHLALVVAAAAAAEALFCIPDSKQNTFASLPLFPLTAAPKVGPVVGAKADSHFEGPMERECK